MILVAGIAASVVFETMTDMQHQALITGDETLTDISTGIKITQISGFTNNTSINQVAFFVSSIAGSSALDLSDTTIIISDSTQQLILRYDNTSFSESVANGLFGTLNASNLSSTEFGILIIRDVDDSCSSDLPVINENDIVAIYVNTSACFQGIDPRTRVSGRIIIEEGMSALYGFTAPSVFVDNIVDLM